MLIRRGTSSTGSLEVFSWGKPTSWAGPTPAPTGEIFDKRCFFTSFACRRNEHHFEQNVGLTLKSLFPSLLQRMSAKSGGCRWYSLPETRGDRLPAAALITGRGVCGVVIRCNQYAWGEPPMTTISLNIYAKFFQHQTAVLIKPALKSHCLLLSTKQRLADTKWGV